MSRNKRIPFVDFYSSHGIIPTRQDITDFRRHFQRRLSLYRHLGLPPAFFRGSSVLEFGPGSGHNSIVTGLLGPQRYVLVDGNPPSLESTKRQLSDHCPGLKFVLKKASISEFKTKERFDLVLAEGLVPTQEHPSKFLRHIAEFVQPGGVLVFTTMDEISLLPEMLRRWSAWQLTRSLKNIDDKVSLLSEFFSKDVGALPGMSRPVEDWVLDQILHPWSGPLYSMPSAVEALGAGWSLLGSSPRFVSDWRWYKTIYGDSIGDNAFVIQSYYEQCHNLLDHSIIAPSIPVSTNRRIERLACKIHALTFRQEHTSKPVPGAVIAKPVIELAGLISKVMPGTARSLRAFASAARAANLAKANFGEFRTLWGRGQQYLSFERHSAGSRTAAKK